jgi:hypothetical protein
MGFMDWFSLELIGHWQAGSILAAIEPDSSVLVNVGHFAWLPKPRPAAALAFDDLVALLQKALALAILALLLLLDVGTFVIGHDSLQSMNSRARP